MLLFGNRMECITETHFTKEELEYWKYSCEWYVKNSHLVTKSDDVIYVDFKNKKVISGLKSDSKFYIQNAA